MGYPRREWGKRWDRTLPADWRDGGWEEKREGFSLPVWKEVLGVLIGAALMVSIPWILQAWGIVFNAKWAIK